MADCLTCIHQEVCEERMAIFDYLKVGSTIYTQDDDRQGWTGREG